MDLRSYGKQDLGSSTESNSGMDENDVKRAIKHFSTMNNSQLMTELAKHVNAKRARGEQADIEKTLDRIKPFLNEEQQTRLEQIMGGIKQ